jgi:serine/threonine protein kinase
MVKGGPLRARDALHICISAARALCAIHGLGHLHRDVKPSNILVPFDAGHPQCDRAVLLDLGIQRNMETDRRTAPGSIAGTFSYMAPEQLAGASQSVAADVYGLGATLFELLFGHAVRRYSGVFRATPADREGPRVFVGTGVLQCLTTEIELPTMPEVDNPIRACIARMLRRRPEARPQSMSDVVRELECLVTG